MLARQSLTNIPGEKRDNAPAESLDDRLYRAAFPELTLIRI
jgi:hypothetical protein